MMNDNYKNESIIYGSTGDDSILFFPISTARYFAKIHSAHRKGITFAELFDQIPDVFETVMENRYDYVYGGSGSVFRSPTCTDYCTDLLKGLYDEYGCGAEEIGDIKIDREFRSFEDFCDFYQKLPLESRLPLCNDRFDENSMPFDILIELIGYGPRIDWAPKDILKKFGHTEWSHWDGEVTIFNREDEEDLVKAFEKAGYKCVRDEKLFAQVYGNDID